MTAERFASGALLILIGLVRKIAIADAVAPEVAFANPAALSSLQLLRGTSLFSLQIYGDFAGYTDIARGTSRMLGIELMENFKHPRQAVICATSCPGFEPHRSRRTLADSCARAP